MYKQHKNGGFRMRASFPIEPAQIAALNPICERLGISVGAACKRAVADFIYTEEMKLGMRRKPGQAADLDHLTV